MLNIRVGTVHTTIGSYPFGNQFNIAECIAFCFFHPAPGPPRLAYTYMKNFHYDKFNAIPEKAPRKESLFYLIVSFLYTYLSFKQQFFLNPHDNGEAFTKSITHANIDRSQLSTHVCLHEKKEKKKTNPLPVDN